MRSNALVSGSSAALVLALLVACDKAPTAPTVADLTGNPQGVPAARLTDLNLVVPESVPPGETAQLRGMAFYSDGSTRDVTTESTWRGYNPLVLSVSPTGVVTAHHPGETRVEFSFDGKSWGKHVMVLPVGTFRLKGKVYDAGIRVSGAEVTVAAGPAAGLVSTTVDGFYSLYGVVADTEIRVTKPGYTEQRKSLHATSHQTLDFELATAAPREIIDGTYTLTITAAPECRSKLSAELLERRYSVVLAQEGPRVTATLQGGTFYASGPQTYNNFRGVLEPERLTFQLSAAWGGSWNPWWDSPVFPNVLQELTASTYFSMYGSVSLTGSGAARSGMLNGVIEAIAGPPEFIRISSCESSGHRVDLTR